MNTNHHEAIIDRDTFNKVQELFASKQTGKHKTPGLRSEYTRFVYSISHNAFLLKKAQYQRKATNEVFENAKARKSDSPRVYARNAFC
jgi:hypothetical protein